MAGKNYSEKNTSSANRRVVVTGMAGITPLGDQWTDIFAKLKKYQNCVCYMHEWDVYKDLNTRLASPVEYFEGLVDVPRKKKRGMGRVAQLAVSATEKALNDAGLWPDYANQAELFRSGRMGVSYGSSSGTPDAIGDFGNMIIRQNMDGINATTYIKMMGHTTAVNIGVFFALTGRIIPTSSACTSGSQGIGFAYEAIKFNQADVMIAGGAEELSATQAAVFDTLYATSTKNDSPEHSPSPYDKHRDGLVIGEGACTLILEEREHAIARGARIYAEVLSFTTNSDGSHITQPSSETMKQVMQNCLNESGLERNEIGYINGHGTATEQGDVAETEATSAIFGQSVPFSSLKSYIGHTLGACGSIEAWLSIMMMREGWFAPTINLTEVDDRCAPLDYIVSEGREFKTNYIMSNNFAFGGINTSLIFANV